MAAYNVTTKVIVHSIPDGSADSVANSYAKEVIKIYKDLLKSKESSYKSWNINVK